MDPGRPGKLLPLVTGLQEALALEAKFQPHIELSAASHDSTEITAGIRDGSAHVLRCLKVWYDLPSDVLFVAINLVDRFLTKMKVRPKHMACISIASFQLAAKEVASALKPEDIIEVPEPKDLALISQCKCTLGDLARMEGIISSKLSGNTLPITSLTFIRLFDSMFTVAAEHAGIDDLYSRVISGPALCLQLEILACDVSCANFRPSEIALVLLCNQLDISTSQFPDLAVLIDFVNEFQQLCQISNENFCRCHETVVHVLERYNTHAQMPYRQRLVWRLSQRTMRLLRPTDKLVSTLPTIDENGQFQIPIRPRSGSLSSEESWESGEEWPCLPMQPLNEEEEEPPSTFHCDMA